VLFLIGKDDCKSGTVPDDVGLAYLYRTSDEMGNTAGIDGNLSAVGAAALDLVVEKLNANRQGSSDHPKEVLIKGTWHEGATLPPNPQKSSRRARLDPSRGT
jgi:hypothetical protein